MRTFRTSFRLAIAIMLFAVFTGSASAGLVPNSLPAAAPATALLAPKWLSLPVVDGLCDDAAYKDAGAPSALLMTPAGRPGGHARVLHSTVDAYICFNGLTPVAGERVVVRADTNDSGGAAPLPGDYEFSLGLDGSLSVQQGDGARGYRPINVPAADFAGQVAKTGRRFSAELRISLEWLGGWAHMIGSSLELDSAEGTPVAQWPAGAGQANPSSWGEMGFGPRYPSSLDTGSAFVDGINSYLVIPYSPALNPPEITIEAWAKSVDGDCGTLIGNGQARSYWLGLCQAIEFSSHDPDTARTGRSPLTGGWHHVAVTQDRTGRRTYYLDGQQDLLAGWEPEQEPNDVPGEARDALGKSDRMLRIGSDRDAVASMNYLHGYIRELRIWDHARTAAEIQREAFVSLTGREAGLLALWPFTHGLADLVSGQNAGLVGNASLAALAPDVTSFRQPPAPPHVDYPRGEPRSAWDAGIPHLPGAQISVDGVCWASEYQGATYAVLEPERIFSPRLVLGSDALYLCTSLLWGSTDPAAPSITLWLDQGGERRTVPGAADLRLVVHADGTLEAATGDGSGFGGPAPEGITAQAIHGDRLAAQEDVRSVDAPWWVAEVRIPLQALGDLPRLGAGRLAIRYDGHTYAGGPVTGGQAAIRPGLTNTGQWPAAFDEGQPASWGAVQVVDANANVSNVTGAGPQAKGSGARLARPSGLQATMPLAPSAGVPARSGYVPVRLANVAARPALLPPARALEGPAGPGWPQQQPTSSDFYGKCGPEETQDINALFLVVPAIKWPRVDFFNHRFVKASGVLTHMEVSREDSPFIHNSHDVDMYLSLDQQDRWLMLLNGEEEVVESESASLPADRRPVPGDHVTVMGQWIFDCGHDPKTEIHPVAFIASDHTELRSTGLPGKRPQPVQVARVSLNAWQGPATLDVVSLADHAPYTFDMRMPNWYASFAQRMPFLRVSKGDPSAVSATFDEASQTMHVSITPQPVFIDFSWELEAGWLDDYAEACNGCTTAEEDTYRVILDSIDVLNDHDTGGNGEWFTVMEVDGKSRQMFWNQSVDENLYNGYGGTYFMPSSMDKVWNVVRAGAGQTVEMDLSGYEDDDLALTGEFLWEQRWTQPLIPGQYTSPIGNLDWILHYHIEKGGTPATILDPEHASFWEPRLDQEDKSVADLGTFPVPPEGQVPETSSLPLYITDPGMNQDNVLLLRPDEDTLSVQFDDWADATFGVIPPQAELTVQPMDEGYWPPDLPNEPPSKSYLLHVKSATGAEGDLPYTLSIKRSWHQMQDDWGEAQDAGGGRQVDLLTPEEGTVVYTALTFGGAPAEHRTRQKPLAWQEVPEDIDTYAVSFPAQKNSPGAGEPCEYDRPGNLTATAWGQRLRVKETGQIADDVLVVDLSTGPWFSGGQLHIQVSSTTGKRDVYTFEAQWADGAYLSPEACAAVRGILQTRDKVAGMTLVDQGAVIQGGRGTVLPYPAPELSFVNVSALGGYRLVQIGRGTSFHALLSGPANQPYAARLYDAANVLLGEMSPVSGQAQLGTRAPAGMLAQGTLDVGNLAPGGLYLLQFVSEAGAKAGVQTVPIGMDQNAQ